MRKVLYSLGAIVVVSTTMFIWLNPVVVNTQAVSASVVSAVESVRTSEATLTSSPLEIMLKVGKSLPVEDWKDPF
jgi:hypothetical protein